MNIINFVKNIFKKEKKSLIRKDARILDLVSYVNAWGNAIYIDKYENGKISGSGFKTTILGNYYQVGDIIRIGMKSGKIGIFAITRFKYCNDPKDMFFYSAEFVKYEGE